jgi:hypothetical protein
VHTTVPVGYDGAKAHPAPEKAVLADFAELNFLSL